MSLVRTAFKRLFFQSLISLPRIENSAHLHILARWWGLGGARQLPWDIILAENIAIYAKCPKDRLCETMNSIFQQKERKLLSHPKCSGLPHSSLHPMDWSIWIGRLVDLFGNVKCRPFVYISFNMPSGKLVSKIHTKYKQISIKHMYAPSREHNSQVKFLLSQNTYIRKRFHKYGFKQKWLGDPCLRPTYKLKGLCLPRKAI